MIVVAENLTASEPYIDQESWTEAKEIILALKKRGYQIIIEPFPYVSGGTEIETGWNPNNMATWFESWGDVLAEVATFAETHNIYGMYIASNLEYMEPFIDEWTTLITRLRILYSNNIIYRTNWWYVSDWDISTGERYQAKLNNPIFGQVDIISIAAYFEITNSVNPSKEEIKEGIYKTTHHNREQNVFEEVKNFYTKWGKPIMFGELGIPPFDQAASKPWNYGQGEEGYSETIQSNWFNAFYEVFSPEDWFIGYSVFTIADTSTVYRVIDRLAEFEIKKHNFFDTKQVSRKDLQELQTEVLNLTQKILQLENK